MSVALLGLFGLCVLGQGWTGWRAYDQSLGAAHMQRLGLGAYLSTGNFLDGIFSNWQAAILQLAVLVSFGSVLRQKGAAHSRKEDASAHRRVHWKFGARPSVTRWIYANSLSLAFFAIFVLSFALHLVFGAMKYNEDQALQHLPPIGRQAYAVSAAFWFSVFQCWEAEFSAMGLYLVLSIFLRQEGSSESKPVGASDDDTGETNE
ncbi:hypothetical protein NFI88_15970 [Acetobacteraceae bacterium KSS12]|uniref:Transmembrane protein n=2 Tax=Rhizosaccharibacter radicis TaxID=2782605 RepID=A0ABT1W1L2_9PROT|nr:hypothetical protein [Acetobacteraceae bacterium KSS12]